MSTGSGVDKAVSTGPGSGVDKAVSNLTSQLELTDVVFVDSPEGGETLDENLLGPRNSLGTACPS